MSAVLGSYAYEMDASYAADFSRDREPMKKRSRHPEYRRKGSAPTRVSGMHCRRNKRWTWGTGRGARMSNLRAFAGCMAVALAAAASSATANPLPVGDPGNAAQTSGANAGLGSVASVFSMWSTETTVAEYTAFLNAVAATDTNNLYNPSMAGIGISRGGSSGSFTYSVTGGLGNRPVAFVSWFDAARYVNYLTSGNTETGSYNLAGPTPTQRLATARYVLPSQNEWYKAAFYRPASSTYGTWASVAGSGTVQPAAAVPPGSAPAANWNNVAGAATTDVGAYVGTTSSYGMYDMLGNIAEWTESTNPGNSSQVRVFSGAFTGAVATTWNADAAAQFRSTTLESSSMGFRVAAVPEPETVTLAAFGIVGLCGANWLKRRRKAGTPETSDAMAIAA